MMKTRKPEEISSRQKFCSHSVVFLEAERMAQWVKEAVAVSKSSTVAGNGVEQRLVYLWTN